MTKLNALNVEQEIDMHRVLNKLLKKIINICNNLSLIKINEYMLCKRAIFFSNSIKFDLNFFFHIKI